MDKLTSAQVKAMATALGIADTGICSASRDNALLVRLQNRQTPFVGDTQKRVDPANVLAGAQSVIVCVFPYATPAPAQVNLSRYVWVKDYHLVVRTYLERLLSQMQAQVPNLQGYVFTDSAPLCDKDLAYRAGLGYFGKNSLLIHPRFGSFFFIGGIVTDIKLEPDTPITDDCGNCNACAAACPAGLCTTGSLDGYKCISYLQQKKGDLTPQEEMLIQKSGSAWGCDICQNACPKNRNVAETSIAEFANPDSYLPPALTEEDFHKFYKDRAFYWRGYKTLRRNLDLLHSDKP